MERLLHVTSTFMEGKVVLAGAELGIFDLLRGDGRTAGQVADALSGDLRGVEVLLDALVALEIVQKGPNGTAPAVYRNRPEYEPLLTAGGKGHVLGLLRHRNRMFRSWALLEDRVLGVPLPDAVRERAILNDPRMNESFIEAMYAAGAANTGVVADQIDFSGVRTAADLGGGPGHYLAEFARRQPGLNAYLLDLPLTLKTASAILQELGMIDRVKLVEWDFYNAEPPAGLPLFDLIFMSSILHAESPEQNRRLWQRLRPMTSPGGRVVVQENTVKEGRTWPVEGALFAVNMLAGTPEGRTYTEGEITGWAAEAGFERVAMKRLSPRACLIQFRRNG